MRTVDNSYWTKLVVDIIRKQGASFEFAVCIISRTPGFVVSGIKVAELEDSALEVLLNTVPLQAMHEAKLARAN